METLKRQAMKFFPVPRHFLTVNNLPIPVEKTLLKNFIFAKNRKDCEG
jgi:hypothetical protein